jgi:hypothetical protein
MLALAQFNLVPLAVALLIGIGTGRWMFANRRAAPPPQAEDSSPS